jgi:feruloyl esterase
LTENQTQLVDFGIRAVHITALLATDAIRKFYGRHTSQSYFVGCSEGGREALRSVQQC